MVAQPDIALIRRARAQGAAFLIASYVGCAPGHESGPSDAGAAVTTLDAGPLMPALVPLLDHSAWRRYDAALDPLPLHQPEVISCPESATFVELGSYEVDTTRCNYVLSEHPSLLALPAGSEVHLNLLHYDLLAAEPTMAHIALSFGDALQWETMIPIPMPADVVETSFRTSRALALDEPIRLHLHNHGANTYLLVSVEARAGASERKDVDAKARASHQ